MNVLKLAWRNLWRNKRRTLITVASIFFGVIFSSLMGSSQEGSYSKMIDNVVKFYSGFMQVQNEEYWDNKTINNTFVPDSSLYRTLEKYEGVTMTVPRLEDFALASYEDNTRGAIILGIEPLAEQALTAIADKISQGNYLSPNDQGVIIGEGLGHSLNLTVGDTLVLLGQGYHGVSAAGKYPVRGFIKHFNPEFNKRVVYMELSQCQSFYTATDHLTSLVLMVKDNDKMKQLLPRLKQDIASPLTVISWEEMFPTMLQQIESDRTTALITKVILYIVIGFGIFGTIMMMMAERKHEFGVMVAIGMQKTRLALVVVVETILIGFVGVVTGLVGSFPVVAYFFFNPIPISGKGGEWIESLGFEPYLFFAWEPKVFFYQMLAVFCMTLFIAMVPLIKLLRFKEINALKD
ncbi:ABC transporter permease [Marinilabiliaceae bacterium JC017]|nr:ABC transporter permease [Marinilabiliaceae bacterium JC017]